MNPVANFCIGQTPVQLLESRYCVGDARAFVLVTDQGEPYGTVTVNVPGYKLAADEVLVKTADENAAARAPLLASGMFEDTGKRVQCGFSQVEVWRVLRESALQ